jgi:hypothetical protein
MNILLMGCSWGVPNYYGLPGDEPETHLEFLIKKLGHNVLNCSLNGGSNLSSLNRVSTYFLEKKDIDHPTSDPAFQCIKYDPKFIVDKVIWFHTDPGRDSHVINRFNKSINQQLEQICRFTYKNISNFFEKLNFQSIAIIGGCADVHTCITEYFRPEFLLPSWQQELIGRSARTWNMQTGLPIPTDEDISIIEKSLAAIHLFEEKRDIFPDGGHPGRIAHKQLFDKLVVSLGLI